MTERSHEGVLGPGVTVGDFVVESVAGRGGMGIVYRARQREPDRVVALKAIAPALAGVRSACGDGPAPTAASAAAARYSRTNVRSHRRQE